MKKKTWITGIVSLLAVGILLGVSLLGGSVSPSKSTLKGNVAGDKKFLDETTVAPTPVPGEIPETVKDQAKSDLFARFQVMLDRLVTAGTITQAQADEAFAVISASTDGVDLQKLPEAVRTALIAQYKADKDIIKALTPEQRDAIKSAMDAGMKDAIAKLVTAGTLTQEQADKLLSGARGCFRMDLTDEQRAAIKTAKDNVRKDVLQKLVKEGVLTQRQADAIASRPMRGLKKGMGFGKDKKPALTAEQLAQMKQQQLTKFKATLDQLVASNAITQAQADEAYAVVSASQDGKIDWSKLSTEVASALKALESEKSDMLKSLSDVQKQAIADASKAAAKTALTDLVKAGTITQEQADAILGTANNGCLQNLTKEQRDAIRTAMQAARKDAIQKLVTDGVLTQDQANAVLSTIPPMMGLGGGMKGPGGMGGFDGQKPDGRPFGEGFGRPSGMMGGGMGGKRRGGYSIVPLCTPVPVPFNPADDDF